jgi:head-tail adaptor
MSIKGSPRRGKRRHLISLRNPGQPVPDGEGGHTIEPEEFATRYAEIAAATVAGLERIAPGTVQSAATHVVTFDYHPSVTTKTTIGFGSRVFEVTGVVNPEERNIDTIALCTEVVT